MNVVWNLKKRGLRHRMRGAFNPKEPQFDITYGEDTFDQEDDELIEELSDLEIG